MNVVRRLAENKIFRFLVTGALNTVVTFGIYLALKIVFDYQIAYFLSYISGILFAYFMNVFFVFEKSLSLRTFIRFPLVYVVQYIVGAIFLELLVHMLGFSATFAPLFVIVFTLPFTFLLSRFVLSKD